MVWLTPAMMVDSASGGCTSNGVWMAKPKASEAVTISAARWGCRAR